jgi:hypothetical protein
MDSKEQAAGEKRVQALLIEPLMRRGLIKPGGMTKAQFDLMLGDLRAKLAGMSDLNLAALEVDAASMAGGKDKDRFPIANRILERAAEIQPPRDDASPLIRAVFAARLGQDAIAGGWAPELLDELRRSRRWPGGWTVDNVKTAASGPRRRLEDLDLRQSRGEALTDSEERFVAFRRGQMQKCRDIADLARAEGTA